MRHCSHEFHFIFGSLEVLEQRKHTQNTRYSKKALFLQVLEIADNLSWSIAASSGEPLCSWLGSDQTPGKH